MQMGFRALACAAALPLVLCAPAFAFDAASDTTPTTTVPAGTLDAGARSAKSIECSQKADAQNLHGKPRKRFMRDCKHGG